MIRVEGLRKSFGSLEVLKGVDLTIPTGRISALVGPNGSGKTTLIKTVLGLVRPDEGRVSVGDHTLNGDWRYRRSIGYMPQIPPLPENLSASELFTMLADLREGSASGAPMGPDLEMVGLFGLEGDLEKPLRSLSGGTRQKVTASLAFMFHPDLLILDEPTAGLDPISARHLKGRMRRDQAAGKTILITSHILSEVQELADHLVFLLDGRVRFQGPLQDVLDLTGEDGLEGAIAALMEQESRSKGGAG